jgi:pilus assembly protein CpaC
MLTFRSVLLLCAVFATTIRPAAADMEPVRLTLGVGQVHVIQAPGVFRIAVGNGKVLQATALDERQVLVLPEGPGQSDLHLWSKETGERRYAIEVLPAELGRIVDEVRAMVGATGTQGRLAVRAVGDKVLIEGADVSDEAAARIGEVVRRYPQVVNLVPRLGLEQMVAIDVRMVEIRREAMESIGVRWNGTLDGPTFSVLGDLHRSHALRPGGSGEDSGLAIRNRVAPFASSVSIASTLTSMINLMVQNGDAVILAEPTLACRSGGTARFVAGGELPIPTSGALGQSSVAFKEYGVKFDVSPVVSDSGVIAARIATEISSVNFDVAVKEVPGLSKRRAETEVNLRENETLVIAGLMTEEGSRSIDRLPGASNLPVLGSLFRSRLFRDRQTELVVFVTPRLVEGQRLPRVGAGGAGASGGAGGAGGLAPASPEEARQLAERAARTLGETRERVTVVE